MELALKAILDKLQQLMQLPTSPTRGSILLCPNAEVVGPEADLKRDIYYKILAVLDTGRSWLSKKSPVGDRHLSSEEYEHIEKILENDPDQSTFFEAYHLAQSAENLMHDIAA